jgi:hypothetical protein
MTALRNRRGSGLIPQGGAALDPYSPLMAGVQAIISPSSPLNLATHVPLGTAGTVNVGMSGAGQAFNFRKNGYVETEVLPAIGTASYVEFWYGIPSADIGAKGQAAEAGFLTGSNSNNIGIAARMGSVSTSNSAPGNWGAVYNWNSMNDAGEVLPVGELTLLVVHRKQTGTELWRNGRLVKFIPQAPANIAASSLICGSFIRDLGYWTSSSDTILAGRVVGDWSPEDVLQFSDDLTMIYGGQRRILPRLAAVANSYTLTTEPGNFALSGSAASIRASRKLVGGNGSFTLTGNAATLRAGRKVSGTTAVINLAGGAAGLAASRKFAAAPGAFALAGAAASLRAARTVAAAPGTFAVVGSGAALRASRRTTGAPAAFALAGSDARLSVARLLAAAAGAFTLSGGAAQLVYSPVVEGNVLFTETGQFVLTGSAVGMRVTRRLQAGPGSFALAGGAASIRCARRLAIDPGAFVVTGGAAVLRVARRLSLAPGAFDLVGNPAVLAYSSTIEYARAPAGSGYTPQRNEYQARPAQVGGARPPAVEKAYR